MKTRILVTGSSGLVGRSLQRYSLKHKLDSNYDFLWASKNKGNLTKEDDVSSLFAYFRPNIVIHLANLVGGIGLHKEKPADVFYQNTLMNLFVTEYSRRHNVEKFIGCSSICVYPENLPKLKEELIHEGKCFSGNLGYGYSKRAMHVQIEEYQKQYKINNYCLLTPVNIYGIDDQFNLEIAHVIPSLIHKLYIAKNIGGEFQIWGNGESKRELIYVEDFTRIIFDLISKEELPPNLIVSNSENYEIKKIVDFLIEISGFDGYIKYEIEKPNGQFSRETDTTLFKGIFPEFQWTPLREGLQQVWDWFNNNYTIARK